MAVIFLPDKDLESADWPKRTKDRLGDLHTESPEGQIENQTENADANCGTGSGGFKPGNTCAKGGRGGSTARYRKVAKENGTPPPPGAAYAPSVTADHNGDGVADCARVGICGDKVPDKIPRLPRLTRKERQVEKAFADAYEKDPDGMASEFRKTTLAMTKPGDAPTFSTDDAKAMSDAWMDPDLARRAHNRAVYNTALHQTANAITKRAFVQHLDTLQPGDEIMVTVGGCGAGKGYAIKNVPQALAIKQRSKAVWDSAGDQNATENPWIQKLADERGLKVTYMFVHADPKVQWAHPARGVVKRAGDPNDGRMVDAKVFADSYAMGARNHNAFYKRNQTNPNARFVFLDNRGSPKLLNGMPAGALRTSRRSLEKFAVEQLHATNAPPRVKRGALVGQRIWSDTLRAE